MKNCRGGGEIRGSLEEFGKGECTVEGVGRSKWRSDNLGLQCKPVEPKVITRVGSSLSLSSITLSLGLK